MVADGHRVELHQVEEFRFGGALVGGEEERALEVVAGVEQKHVLARQFLALLVYQRLEAGDASEALVLALFLGRAGRIELVDRFDARMKVVDVQDVQFIIGKSCARREREKGSGKEARPHVSDHGLLLCAVGRVPGKTRRAVADVFTSRDRLQAANACLLCRISDKVKPTRREKRPRWRAG